MNLRQKKSFLLISFFSLLILLFSMLHYSVPSNIYLVAGREQQFSGLLPITADLSDELSTVMANDTQAVDGNISITPGKPVTVRCFSPTRGSAQVSLLGILPLKTVNVEVLPDKPLVVSGQAVGIYVHTDGLLVLGTGTVETKSGTENPANGYRRSGDRILSQNGIPLKTKEDLLKAVETCDGKPMTITFLRDGETKTETITPVKSIDDNQYHLGVWIRDSTQGIGTLTFYDKQSGAFGALGHGIYDVDTGKLMSIKDGKMTASVINSISPSEKGEPGELTGSLKKTTEFGSVHKNTEYGVFGTLTEPLDGKEYAIGLKQEVHTGPATMICDLGNGPEEFQVEIRNVNHFNTPDKSMIIEITDKDLLSQTNGIIQGMSGSPLIQDNKLIGAVTHVFVNEPEKGYGILIENMLKEANN